MISILIPTFNNINYLNLTIQSIKKNSSLNNHEILLHINDGSDGTLDFAKKNHIPFTHSKNNVGLSCSGLVKICSMYPFSSASTKMPNSANFLTSSSMKPNRSLSVL